MIVPKKNRIAVYSYLFKEGVLVAKKDVVNKHPRIEGDIPNVEVLGLMKSFVSRGLVRHTYNWRYSYYYLNDEGIEYLREYLHIPAEVQPATLTKGAPKAPAGRGGRDGDYEGRRGGDFKRGGDRGDRGERGGYRRGGDGGDRGFGRGRRAERE